MYARYIPKKVVFIKFDLEADKEIAAAFAFFFGGTQNTPFEEKTRHQMEKVVENLKKDLLVKVYKEQEASNFQVCSKCVTEIDLRMKGTYSFVQDNYLHNSCPPLKSEKERDV